MSERDTDRQTERDRQRERHTHTQTQVDWTTEGLKRIDWLTYYKTKIDRQIKRCTLPYDVYRTLFFHLKAQVIVFIKA